MSNNVDNDNNKNNDGKKILTLIVLIAVVMICTTSATYAYFALTATNSAANGTAATASLELTVSEATLKTNTGVMVPQLESALSTAMNSTNKCVDANSNIICKVYTITVTNKSTAAVKVNGTIQFTLTGTDVTMTNLKWKRATSATTLGTSTGGSYNGIAVGTIDTLSSTTNISATSSIFDLTAGTACTISTGNGCTDVPLAKSTGSATYYIVIWINETNSVQTDAGTWTATVHFEGENGKGVTSTITG